MWVVGRLKIARLEIDLAHSQRLYKAADEYGVNLEHQLGEIVRNTPKSRPAGWGQE